MNQALYAHMNNKRKMKKKKKIARVLSKCLVVMTGSQLEGPSISQNVM
jgi:hypothetical protein